MSGLQYSGLELQVPAKQDFRGIRWILRGLRVMERNDISAACWHAEHGQLHHGRSPLG